MNMDEILIKSKNMKNQADKILNDSGIIDILMGYGEVKIAGSYALDVMLRPDIDIYVIAEMNDWHNAKNIYMKIIESKYFREVSFVNWTDFSNNSSVDLWTPSIKGYYIKSITPTETDLWKMDIWLITPEYDKSSERTDLFKKLLNEQGDSKRKLILEIKNFTRKGGGYIDGVDGKLIYQAVLINGVKNTEEFLSFIQNK